MAVHDPDMLARVRAATALRRLGHGIVGHEISGSLLTAIAEQVESWVPDVEAGRGRSRSVESMKRDHFSRPAEGSPIGTFPDCVVSGDANPMGLDVQFYREGDEAVSSEFSPGRGGSRSTVVDTVHGSCATTNPLVPRGGCLGRGGSRRAATSANGETRTEGPLTMAGASPR